MTYLSDLRPFLSLVDAKREFAIKNKKSFLKVNHRSRVFSISIIQWHPLGEKWLTDTPVWSRKCDESHPLSSISFPFIKSFLLQLFSCFRITTFFVQVYFPAALAGRHIWCTPNILKRQSIGQNCPCKDKDIQPVKYVWFTSNFDFYTHHHFSNSHVSNLLFTTFNRRINNKSIACRRSWYGQNVLSTGLLQAVSKSYDNSANNELKQS